MHHLNISAPPAWPNPTPSHAAAHRPELTPFAQSLPFDPIDQGEMLRARDEEVARANSERSRIEEDERREGGRRGEEGGGGEVGPRAHRVGAAAALAAEKEAEEEEARKGMEVELP